MIGGLPQERKNSVTIIIDDVSLMEVAAKGSTNLVLDFLHYCHTLTSELVRHINYFLCCLNDAVSFFELSCGYVLYPFRHRVVL